MRSRRAGRSPQDRLHRHKFRPRTSKPQARRLRTNPEWSIRGLPFLGGGAVSPVRRVAIGHLAPVGVLLSHGRAGVPARTAPTDGITRWHGRGRFRWPWCNSTCATGGDRVDEALPYGGWEVAGLHAAESDLARACARVVTSNGCGWTPGAVGGSDRNAAVHCCLAAYAWQSRTSAFHKQPRSCTTWSETPTRARPLENRLHSAVGIFPAEYEAQRRSPWRENQRRPPYGTRGGPDPLPDPLRFNELSQEHPPVPGSQCTL
jgi:hypothetical protein